jgi:hypothetical protein
MGCQTTIELGLELGRDFQLVTALVDHALPKTLDEAQALVRAESEGRVLGRFHDNNISRPPACVIGSTRAALSSSRSPSARVDTGAYRIALER